MREKIRFYCSGCRKPVSAPKAFAGGQAKCKHCGQNIPIPLESTRESLATARVPPQINKAHDSGERPGLWADSSIKATLKTESSTRAAADEAAPKSQAATPEPVDGRTEEAWKKVFRGRPETAEV